MEVVIKSLKFNLEKIHKKLIQVSKLNIDFILKQILLEIPLNRYNFRIKRSDLLLNFK